MALNKPGSDSISRQSYRLHATHNPTQTAPSFLLPIFSRPPHGNALYAQTVSLNAEAILGFEVISDALKLEECQDDLIARVNHPVIHAFETPTSNVIVGTRSELRPRLTPLVGDQSLLDLPSLRLDVVEFCNLDQLIPEAADGVYRFLHSVSPYSATYWRDHTFLADRARRNLQKYIYSREVKFDDWKQLDGVTLAIKNKRPVLTCSAELYNNLKPDIDWEAWVDSLKEGLRFHIGAFAKSAQLQFMVETDPAPSEEVPMSLPSIGADPESLLIAAFGQTAIFATREVKRRGIAAVHIDTSRGWNRQVKATISAAQRRSRQQGEEPPILLVVLSSAEESTLAALPFLEALPSEVRLYGIVLYRTQDGVPSDEQGLELFKSRRFERLIVVPDNDFPIGEAHTKTSRGTLLASLIGVLNRLLKDGRNIPRGRAIYSMAWTRYGLRGYEGALARSIAAAANPWVSVNRAKRAIVSLSSVGRPDIEFSEDVTRQLNEMLFHADGKVARGRELTVDAKWIQRRFMPGGNIPATIELLLTGIVDEPLSPEESLAEAARIVLSAAGYDVRNERNSTISISANSDEPLLIAVRDIARSKTPRVYVQLMPNKRSQQSALGQYDAWKTALPLLVGDLYFLANVQDPKWTATLLAHLAQPKRLWQTVLKEFIEQSLQRELRRSDSYRNLWQKDLPKSAVITATSIEIESTERLVGRQAKIGGSMTVDFSLSTSRKRGRSERSKSAKFEVKIGPDEFSVVKFELTT